ncbi:hypothetical protein B0H14DRAFT_3441368 [Mycena olivaceomarginata]|nr:hypothetical protein B0H14DRAFT_3441368 [Mycena olivaceomarginata]
MRGLDFAWPASVRSSSFVRLKSKNEQPSAHESIEPGIGRGIIKLFSGGNPNAAAKSIFSGTAKKLTRNPLNGASVGGDGQEALEH